MPKYVERDPKLKKLWDEAKKEVQTRYKLSPKDGERYWKLVNSIYTTMTSGKHLRRKMKAKKAEAASRQADRRARPVKETWRYPQMKMRPSFDLVESVVSGRDPQSVVDSLQESHEENLSSFDDLNEVWGIWESLDDHSLRMYASALPKSVSNDINEMLDVLDGIGESLNACREQAIEDGDPQVAEDLSELIAAMAEKKTEVLEGIASSLGLMEQDEEEDEDEDEEEDEDEDEEEDDEEVEEAKCSKCEKEDEEEEEEEDEEDEEEDDEEEKDESVEGEVTLDEDDIRGISTSLSSVWPIVDSMSSVMNTLFEE